MEIPYEFAYIKQFKEQNIDKSLNVTVSQFEETLYKHSLSKIRNAVTSSKTIIIYKYNKLWTTKE